MAAAAFPIPADEEARLRLLREMDVLDSLPEPAYDDLARVAAYICQTPVALVTLIDGDRQWFKARVDFQPQETPRDQSFCAHAIAKPDELLVVPDATKDPRFARNPLVLEDPRIRFYAGAPLVTSKGTALGTLCVIDRAPRDLSEEQRDALRALSRQVTLMLESRRVALALADVLKAVRRIQEETQARHVSRPLVRQLMSDLLEMGGLDRSTLLLLGRRMAPSEVEGLDAGLRGYGEMGLGQLRLAEASGERFVFEGHDLIERAPGTRETTCYLALGFLNGLVARVEGGEALGAELACQSRGDARCRFAVRKKP